jgi:predicted nuclease of predicted toxin-antitoxin system
LGTGASDRAIAQFSLETERAIVTHDDDFVEAIPVSAYRAVLYFGDESLSAANILRSSPRWRRSSRTKSYRGSN